MRERFIYDPGDVMPHGLQRRHAFLCEWARQCYDMRNATRQSDPEKARAFHAQGDVYLSRGLALSAEWDA
jgi:hypothetical protein